jgi:hypothetical protein
MILIEHPPPKRNGKVTRIFSVTDFGSGGQLCVTTHHVNAKCTVRTSCASRKPAQFSGKDFFNSTYLTAFGNYHSKSVLQMASQRRETLPLEC